VGINLFVPLIMEIGIEHLDGIQVLTVRWQNSDRLIFSAQNATTVGYGHISPSGFF
jgi:inward rectifier potassium channel